jgi:two-component system response regulator MprA
MKSSIMVVDDEPLTRNMLCTLLGLYGFQVSEAEDGLDALDKVGDIRPDIMILDVMMPHMDGITTCKVLRSKPETAQMPIIMLSGKTQISAVEEGIQAGADKYMAKPMNHQELLAGISELLGLAAVPQLVGVS